MTQRNIFDHMSDEQKNKLEIQHFTHINPNMRTDELFPPKENNQRNRIGMAVFAMFDFLRLNTNVDASITYPKRSEYVTFPTVAAIYDYFYEYVLFKI
jgi:hypothetical protein